MPAVQRVRTMGDVEGRPTDPDPIAGLVESPDPYRLIAEVVREELPAEQAEPLLDRIGAALERLVPADWDELALQNAQMRHELELLASTDRLTGLRNRQRFFEDLRREFAAARRYGDPLSLLLVDVDGLGEVNATRGFRAGDELLVSLAETLLRGLRVSDFAARLGNDDFAVLLPRTGRDGAAAVAMRLRDTISSPITVGIAVLDSETTSGAELLERADRDLAAGRQRRGNPPAVPAT
jgi:diguanylate cyclase (GGDEF)-like protein